MTKTLSDLDFQEYWVSLIHDMIGRHVEQVGTVDDVFLVAFGVSDRWESVETPHGSLRVRFHPKHVRGGVFLRRYDRTMTQAEREFLDGLAEIIAEKLMRSKEAERE